MIFAGVSSVLGLGVMFQLSGLHGNVPGSMKVPNHQQSARNRKSRNRVAVRNLSREIAQLDAADLIVAHALWEKRAAVKEFKTNSFQ